MAYVILDYLLKHVDTVFCQKQYAAHDNLLFYHQNWFEFCVIANFGALFAMHWQMVLDILLEWLVILLILVQKVH